MKKLNVIDLDKTLIDFDSFSIYFFHYFFKPKYFFPLAWIAFKRKTGTITSSEFAMDLMLITRKDRAFGSYNKLLSKKIIESINKSVLSSINSKIGKDHITILCSASPIYYVKFVAEFMQWQSLASHFDDQNKFIHMYGKNKLIHIQKHYPIDHFSYNFSISDSGSDLEMMQQFKEYILLK